MAKQIEFKSIESIEIVTVLVAIVPLAVVGNVLFTVFENHIKSLIQHCERSELSLHFGWTKVYLKMQKIVHYGEFLKI